MTSKVSSYILYPITIKKCTCDTILGSYQKEIEEDIIKEFQNTNNLNEAKMNVFKRYGFKMCCRDKLINPPFVTVTDNEGDDSYCNFLAEGNEVKNNRVYDSNKEISLFMPHTRDNVEFNHKDYSRQINNNIGFPERNYTFGHIDFAKIYSQPVIEEQKNKL